MPETQSTATTCPYCGVGCGVQMEGAEGSFKARGDGAHSANSGRLCVKGTALGDTLDNNSRLTTPELDGEPVSWTIALDRVANAFRSARADHGPESIAMYLSGQLLTEDYYIANKLMKGFLGSANVDTNSRLCMASAVAGYKRAFGEDVVPCNYSDLDDCDLLVFVGSNAAWTHPVLYQRAVASKQANPGKRLIVIDVRRTPTCDSADDVLLINPGTDGYLFAGLMRFLSDQGYVNHTWVEAHTTGLQAALDAVSELSIANVASVTGLPIDAIREFYKAFARTERVVSFYSQGINQSATGTDKCNAIINCHLLTGRLGRPGMGPFSITGQPNAMGGREVGGLANQLAAHMDFGDDDVARVSRFWSAEDMATGPGYKAVELFERAAEGEIKALWIMGTNPMVSLPHSSLVKRALERTEFVVVSDCTRNTETAALADLLLPAAPWGEKDGTVTNSERVISRQRPFRISLGQSLPDWKIIAEIAVRLGFSDAFDYDSPAEIFREHAALSGFENRGSRLFDISSLQTLSDAEYQQLKPTQWPTGPLGKPFSDNAFPTPSGKAAIVPITPAQPQSLGAKTKTPTLLLNTGRLRDHWHTMTRTGLAPKLAKHREFLSVWVNPLDVAKLGLLVGSPVEVGNDQGRFLALMEADPAVQPGHCFAPIHWSAPFTGNGKVSEVIPPITDPHSGQPESKVARVALKPLVVNSWATVVSSVPPDSAELSRETAYWSTIAIEEGWLTLVADGADAKGLYRKLVRASHSEEVASYEDERRQDYRGVLTMAPTAPLMVFVSCDRSRLPRQMAVSLLLKDIASRDFMDLLAGAIGTVSDQGKTVCTCYEVGTAAIEKAISEGIDSVEGLGHRLKCGTQCGSCVPELRALLANEFSEAAA